MYLRPAGRFDTLTLHAVDVGYVIEPMAAVVDVTMTEAVSAVLYACYNLEPDISRNMTALIAGTGAGVMAERAIWAVALFPKASVGCIVTVYVSGDN